MSKLISKSKLQELMLPLLRIAEVIGRVIFQIINNLNNYKMDQPVEKTKSTLEKFLDFIASISALSFFFSLILKVWMPEESQWILNRICATAILLFIAALFMFGLHCYKPKT